MDPAALRSLVVGKEWRLPLLSLGFGAVYAAALVLVGFVELTPSEEVITVVSVPLAIGLTHYGSGLVSNWIGTLPFVFFASWMRPRGDVGVPPPPIEVLPHALAMAITGGSFGYLFTKLTARRHDTPPVWVPLGYFLTAAVIAGLLLVFLDRFVRSCVLIPC